MHNALAKGVRAELIGDSIVINIDEVQAVANDKLLLTVELPAGSTLKVYNQHPSLDIHFDHVDMGAVNVATCGDLLFDNVEMGALMTLESDSKKSLSLKSSDIGAVKINGNNTSLAVSHSNVGAMSVAGTCDAITLDDSNIGVMSWNDECNEKAVVNDCAMTVKVKENIVNVTYESKDKIVSQKDRITNIADLISKILGTKLVFEADITKIEKGILLKRRLYYV